MTAPRVWYMRMDEGHARGPGAEECVWARMLDKQEWMKERGTHTNTVGGIKWFMLNLNNSRWLSNQQVFGFSLFTLQSTGPGT